MPEYPFNSNLHEIAGDIALGNFGLWYNKFVPLGDFTECKASDLSGKKEERHAYYKSQYDLFKKGRIAQALLQQRHCGQIHFCSTMENRGYVKLVFKAELRKPLVTGLGESHPSETSLVFDHTSGIPYIPASSIKGIIRFAHSLNLLFDDSGNFSSEFVIQGKNDENEIDEVLDEANNDTWIPQIFGGDSRGQDKKITTNRGQVIFLDAYPETIPDLHVDIINPHYKKYHGSEDEAPGDYCDPEPIKFLTIAKSSSFVFRMLVPEVISFPMEKIRKAFLDVLENHGIGAKTATGYGRFSPPVEQEPKRLQENFDNYLNQRSTSEEKKKRKISEFIASVNLLEKEGNEVDRLFSLWQQDEDIKDDKLIAEAFKFKVRKKKSTGDFTKHYTDIAHILDLDLSEKKKSQELNGSDGDEKKSSAKDHAKTQEKLNRIIAKGFISRGQKNKILENHKNDFPDLCAMIKKLPKKAK